MMFASTIVPGADDVVVAFIENSNCRFSFFAKTSWQDGLNTPLFP
jgi:hypothetical protein